MNSTKKPKQVTLEWKNEIMNKKRFDIEQYKEEFQFFKKLYRKMSQKNTQSLAGYMNGSIY